MKNLIMVLLLIVVVTKLTPTLYDFSHRTKKLTPNQITLIENINGVQWVDQNRDGYEITVSIGKAFDWKKDGIEEGVINAIMLNK